MALISDLVSAIAEVEGLPEESVNLIARYTREAGFLSQGARGRNAPRATVSDAANLLIAVNASGCVVKEAPQAVELYRDLVCHAPHGSRAATRHGVEYGQIEPDELRFLDRHGAATFGEMLESIIDRFVGGELHSFMMGQTVAYLHGPFYEKAAADLGDDPKALAERVIEASKSFLNLETVAFKIEFFRPLPHAKIIVDRSVGGDRELIAGASFIVNTDDMMAGKFNSIPGGDRREVTTIGYKTLMKVAETLKL